MNVEAQPRATSDEGGGESTLPGGGGVARGGRALFTVHEQLAVYRFDLAARALYEFTWNEYCDWYLELTKPLLQDGSAPAARQSATRRNLINVLEALLRALHPMMPFITEELWQKVAPLAGVSAPSVMLQPYPAAADFRTDHEAEAEISWLQGFVLGVRQIRGEMDIAPSRPITVLLQNCAPADLQRVESHRLYLQQLARLHDITVLDASREPPVCATALLGSMKILVPMADLIDVAAERERLGKALAKAQADHARIATKLANRQFVANAPAEVVEKERARLRNTEQETRQLGEQLARLTTPTP
jgi:valyl-tRNA synthetase